MTLEYDDVDRHAKHRDNKMVNRSKQKRMRGDRSVFTIQRTIVKRGRDVARQVDEEASDSD